MAQIRVAVIGTRGFPGLQGGVEKHCEELYPRLVKLGCRVRVYARKCYVGPTRKDYKGVEIYPLWAPRKKSIEAVVHTFLAVLHAGLNRKNFDIVHIHAIGPSLLAPLARMFGFKVIVTNHGPDYDREKWGFFAKTVLRMGERAGASFATRLISVSKHIKKTIEQRYNRQSLYIPNGVEIKPLTRPGALMGRYGLKKHGYALAVGRLVPEKGFHDLLDAFAGIDTDWKLVIAGNADHEDDYSRGLREKAARDSRVVLTGFITGPGLSEVYSNAGFLVLPSYHEGLPITILEAMSYNLPVLASRIPANTELIENEERSFMPGDIAAMKEKISRAIHGDAGKDTAPANKKRIQEEFNWDNIAKETMKVYNSVL
ncbi:MAG: glycosyltransferase family 4 protein [Deltaproteobacteria bacterium]|nr:glycosyltransferase family 4 protein [Deltaproteobacteria bacterium]